VTGTEPDGKGGFALTHVAPGTYTVTARGPGLVDIAKPVEITVREGETTRVVLQAP
jgi:hypothetical protein